ncbi:MAG: DUF47 family protein [Pseudomonadota bacterium]
MGFFNIFLRKQRRIEKRLFNYLEQWQKCMESFREAMQIYMDKGLGEEFDFHVAATHKLESQADDLRRQIEWDMYAKSLLPESRGDILRFLEIMDRIPGKAEAVLFDIQLQKIVWPKELNPNLERIINLACEAVRLTYEASCKLIRNEKDILPLTDRIDKKESECDHAERSTTTKLFEMDIDCSQKILLKTIIIELGTIANRAENAGDVLTILSVKRRV